MSLFYNAFVRATHVNADSDVTITLSQHHQREIQPNVPSSTSSRMLAFRSSSSFSSTFSRRPNSIHLNFQLIIFEETDPSKQISISSTNIIFRVLTYNTVQLKGANMQQCLRRFLSLQSAPATLTLGFAAGQQNFRRKRSGNRQRFPSAIPKQRSS